VYNTSTARLTDSTVSANAVGFHDGGGIMNYAGTLTLVNSTVMGNKAPHQGGGIYNVDRANLTNSTISGNSAGADGGGVYNFGALDTYNATIAENIADSDNNGSETGGGLFNKAGDPLNVRNTIIAGNLHLDPGGQRPLAVADDCSGTISSQGFNLIQSLNGCTIDGTMADRTGVDPRLAVLDNYGGFSWTHALPADSPAVDHGNPAGCLDASDLPLATDQRGAPRPYGARCDIGSFEFGSAVPTPTEVASPSPSAPPTDTPSATSTATATPSPTSTATASPSPTSTATASPSPTSTATASPLPTATPSATAPPPPSDTPPASPSPTWTPTLPASASSTATATSTNWATSTPTSSTPSPTASATYPLYCPLVRKDP
jgi:hypothetical protein